MFVPFRTIDNRMSQAPPPSLNLPRPPQGSRARARGLLLGTAAAIALLAIVAAVWWVNQGAFSFGSPTIPGEIGSDAPKVGQIAPGFSAQKVDGAVVSLSELRGQVVLINFWATWCGPCRAEMPDLDAVYQQYKEQGFALLGVNYQETPDQIQGFTSELRVGFPIAQDPSGEIARTYRVRGFPTSFFIDRNGTVAEVRIGPLNHDLVIDTLNKMLKSA